MLLNFIKKLKFIYDNYIHIFQRKNYNHDVPSLFIRTKQFNCIKDWWMRRKLYICLIESTRYTFMLSERELYIYVRGISCSSFGKNCSNKKSVLGKVNRRTGSYGY